MVVPRSIQPSFRRPVVALIVLGCFASAVAAQEKRSTITGRVVQAETGDPLAGVQIRLLNVRKRTKTNKVGRFRFAKLKPGPYQVEVALIGLRPLHAIVNVGESETKEIEFRTDSVGVLLPTVYVDGESQPYLITVLSTFDRRMALGNGRFITREQIIQRNPMRLMDLIRFMPGVRTHCRGSTCDVRLNTNPRNCPPAVWVDDVQTSIAMLNSTNPSDVAGIEMYRGASQTPAELNNETARCGGAIVIWTRRGLSK